VLSRLQSSPTQRRPGQPARCRRPVVSIPAALRSALLALLLPGLLLCQAARAQDFTINLKETDIQELIKFVAEATDTTIVVDPAVKGKVKVVSSRPVNRDELYDLFLAILDVHGYTAVSSGGVVRIIQNKDARSASVPVADGLPGSGLNDEYVTQVIRLDNISAAKLIPVLRPLVPQQAHMAAYAPSNAIIISDSASNISRIRDIIQRMDQSAVQETDVVALRYAVAEDVVRMLEQLNKSAQQQNSGEGEVLLVADKRTNSVLVTGDELQRARMRKLIAFVDTPLEQTGNVKVVYLEYARATEIAEVLTRVMQNIDKLDTGDGKGSRSGGNTSTIEADEGTNALIITADADEMAALESVIQRLDIRRAQVLVEAIIVELEVIDGQDLGLQWLFANDAGFYGSNINASDARARNIASAIVPPSGGESSGTTTGDFDVGNLAAALAQTPGLSLGWGVIDDDLSMTVILNALRGTAQRQYPVHAEPADPGQPGGVYHRGSGSAVHHRLLHQYGHGERCAEPVPDHRAPERGHHAHGDAPGQRGGLGGTGYRAGGEQSHRRHPDRVGGGRRPDHQRAQDSDQGTRRRRSYRRTRRPDQGRRAEHGAARAAAR
jgi:general secretion pathway protein D